MSVAFTKAIATCLNHASKSSGENHDMRGEVFLAILNSMGSETLGTSFLVALFSLKDLTVCYDDSNCKSLRSSIANYFDRNAIGLII